MQPQQILLPYLARKSRLSRLSFWYFGNVIGTILAMFSLLYVSPFPISPPFKLASNKLV